MPKSTSGPEPRPHLNSAKWNAYFLHGVQLSSIYAKKCCVAVGCPRCKAAKDWPCFTASGAWSSTPHAARWEAYRATLPTE